MTKQKKKALLIGTGVLALVGGSLFLFSSKANAAPSASDDELEDDETDVDDDEANDEGIDLEPPVMDRVPPPNVVADDQDDDDEPPGPPPVTIPPVTIPPILPGAPPVTLPPVTLPPVTLPPAAPPVQQAPPVTLPPVKLPPTVAVPQVPPVTPPPLDPLTAQMVTDLLSAEKATGWKRTYSSVRAWQAARGLTADGKFGPGAATRLAMEVGTIPIVRYWPLAAGPNPQAALDDYRAGLLTIASKMPPTHAANLQRSAARERGQSFGPPTGDGGKFAITEGF